MTLRLHEVTSIAVIEIKKAVIGAQREKTPLSCRFLRIRVRNEPEGIYEHA